MTDNNLFGNTSSERVFGPDQLGDHLKIARPEAWSLLVGVAAIVLAACIWAFAITIPESVKVDGVAFFSEGELYVYAYLPLGAAKRLEVGMPVQISPDYAPRESYGFIKGTVESIGREPVVRQAVIGFFGSSSYIEGLMPSGNAVEVKIAPGYGGDGLLDWSNEKGRRISLDKGAYCSCLVITRERKPFDLIFNS